MEHGENNMGNNPQKGVGCAAGEDGAAYVRYRLFTTAELTLLSVNEKGICAWMHKAQKQA